MASPCLDERARVRSFLPMCLPIFLALLACVSVAGAVVIAIGWNDAEASWALLLAGLVLLVPLGKRLFAMTWADIV